MTSFLTIHFDEKYYHVIRMIFDQYWCMDSPIELILRKEHLKYPPKKWASITGIYAGIDGMIIYKISNKNIGIVEMNLEKLKELSIVTDYIIESE